MTLFLLSFAFQFPLSVDGQRRRRHVGQVDWVSRRGSREGVRPAGQIMGHLQLQRQQNGRRRRQCSGMRSSLPAADRPRWGVPTWPTWSTYLCQRGREGALQPFCTSSSNTKPGATWLIGIILNHLKINDHATTINNNFIATHQWSFCLKYHPRADLQPLQVLSFLISCQTHLRPICLIKKHFSDE